MKRREVQLDWRTAVALFRDPLARYTNALSLCMKYVWRSPTSDIGQKRRAGRSPVTSDPPG